MSAKQDGPAIRVKDLHKTYRIYRKPSDVLGEVFTGRKRHTEFEALKGVSFEVGWGQIVGIVGRNGAGKSTLLKVLTGATEATSGEVDVNGRLSQMLELGTGFHPDYTGAENIFQGGFCLGMSRAEIERKFDSIVAFSEIGEFIDRPFRTYSLGMQARLTFSVAIHIDPEVLIIDEWLAVGDARFAMKCYDKIRQFRQQGATVLFVTHNYPTITEFCDRALIIDRGRIHFEGQPGEAVYRYSKLLYGENTPEPSAAASAGALEAPADVSQAPLPEVPAQEAEARTQARNIIAHDFNTRYGEGGARVEAVSVLDGEGRPGHIVRSGDPFTIRMHASIEQDIPELVVGLYVKDRVGRVITSTTNHCFADLPRLTDIKAGAQLVVDIQGSMTLSAGYYFLGTTLGKPDGQKYDVIDGVVMIEVAASPHVLADSVVNFFPKLTVREASGA